MRVPSSYWRVWHARISWSTSPHQSEFEDLARPDEGLFNIICNVAPACLGDKFLRDASKGITCIALAPIQDLADSRNLIEVQKKLGAILDAILLQRFGAGEPLFSHKQGCSFSTMVGMCAH